MLVNNDFNNLAKRKSHSFKKIILACAVFLVSIPVFAQQITTDSAGVFCNTVGAPLPQGSMGSEVAALQSLLRQKYAYKVAATGFFGPVTDYYVRALQKSLGVRNPSGALGPLTMALLKNKWCTPVIANQTTTTGPVPVTTTTIVTNQTQDTTSSGLSSTLATTTNVAINQYQTVTPNQSSTSGATTNLVTSQTTTSNSSFTATTTSTFNQTPVTTTNSDSSVNTTVPAANTAIQPTLVVSVDPQAVPVGGTTNLKWKATNVTKCTMSTIGQTKQVAIEGSMTAGVFPSVRSASVNESSYNPNLYSITCDGVYGSIAKEVLLK